MKKKEPQWEKTVVGLRVPLRVPVWLLAPCKQLTLLLVDFCLCARQVTHRETTTRATETLGRARRVAGETEDGRRLARSTHDGLLTEDHLTSRDPPGGHHQPAHTLPLLHLPGKALAILLPPVESQVLRGAGKNLPTSRAGSTHSSTEETGPLFPSPHVGHLFPSYKINPILSAVLTQLSLCTIHSHRISETSWHPAKGESGPGFDFLYLQLTPRLQIQRSKYQDRQILHCVLQIIAL